MIPMKVIIDNIVNGLKIHYTIDVYEISEKVQIVKSYSQDNEFWQIKEILWRLT